MKKFRKIFWSKIWHYQKKLAKTPFWKIQSRVLGKGKNSKKFLVSNLAWPKKVAPDPLWKIQSRVPGKGKHSVKFLVSNLAWWRKVGAQTHPPTKNSVSRALCKVRNSEQFFDLKFSMTKKSWCPTSTNSESRMLCKVKNSVKCLTSNLKWLKKGGPQTPPPPAKNLECTVLSKWKIPKKIFVFSNLASPKKLIQTHFWKIQSVECLVKEKIRKKF